MLFYGTTTKGMGKCCCDSGEAVDVGWNDQRNMLPYDGRDSQYPRQDPMTLPGDRSRRNGHPYNDNQYNRYGSGSANQGRLPGDMRQVSHRGGNNPDGSSLGRNNDPYRNGNNHSYGRSDPSLPANRRGLDNDHRNYPSNQSKGGVPASSSNLLPPQSNLSRQSSRQTTPNASPGSSPDNRGNLPNMRQCPKERPVNSNVDTRGPFNSNNNGKNDLRSKSPNHPALPTLPKPALMGDQSMQSGAKRAEHKTRNSNVGTDVQKQAQSNLSRSRSPAAKEARTGSTNSKPTKKAEGKKRETASDDEEDEDADADARSVKSQTKTSKTSRGRGTIANATR